MSAEWLDTGIYCQMLPKSFADLLFTSPWCMHACHRILTTPALRESAMFRFFSFPCLATTDVAAPRRAPLLWSPHLTADLPRMDLRRCSRTPTSHAAPPATMGPPEEPSTLSHLLREFAMRPIRLAILFITVLATLGVMTPASAVTSASCGITWGSQPQWEA